MDNNLRTVKASDLREYVDATINKHCTRAVPRYVRSFYFDFVITIPEDDPSVADNIQNAMADLYKHGIITDEPPTYLNSLKKDTEIHIMLIHPFNIVD